MRRKQPWIGHVRTWLDRPQVQVLEPGPGLLQRTFEILETLGAAGNLVTNAQLAALAIDNEAHLHTADSDFVRIKGLRWLNPVTQSSSAHLRRGSSA